MRCLTTWAGGCLGRFARGDSFVAASEHFATGLSNQDGVFELCGAFAVGSDCGPIVIPHMKLISAKRDHGLDGEDHAGLHEHVVARIEVVQNLNVGVELFTYSVTDESANNPHAMNLRVIFNCFADIAERTIGLHSLNTQPQTFFSDFDKFAIDLADVADKESCVGVAVNSVDITRHIKIDDVSVFNNSVVGNAVTDHFIE